MTNERRTEDATERAVLIARRIAAGDDLRIREQIETFSGKADYSDRESLAIEEMAWEQVCKAGIEPRLVFAHPSVLKAMPQASLHYRGISLLSRKSVAGIVGTVDSWEQPDSKPQVADQKALDVCRLYNAVISSLITDKTDWTMENGYRNVLATIGISADGSMRNLIGQLGERAIKERLLEWVRDHDLLVDDAGDPDSLEFHGAWDLTGSVRMRFAPEPDVGFEKDGVLVALIEVKAGKDPAGALERLGAIKKTFDEAPAGCKNFLVAGVVTPTMRERLDEMRMERDFDIDRLLHDADSWTDFMNEIFHHALRIAPDVHSLGSGD